MNAPAAADAAAMGWPRAVLGALNATAALVPLMLGWAVIAFGALGPGAGQVALTACAVSVVLGSLVHLVISRAAMPSAAPSSSASVLLGAGVMQLWRDGAFQAPGGLAALLAATSLIVIGSGVLMVLLGWVRAGVLVRYVPQPVLGGFMNGIAVLMVMAQLPVIFGAAAGWLTAALALAAAVVTAAVMILVQRRWPTVPAALTALVLGSLAAVALQRGCAAAWPQAAAAECTLRTLGVLEVTWPAPVGLLALGDASTWALLGRHAGTLVSTALLLALVGALESALNIAQFDLRLGCRTDPDREFVALGVANIASGALAGMPVVFLRLRAMAILAAGAMGARPALLSSLMVAAVSVVALPLFAHVPLAVVAGIVCMLAWALVDRWTRELVAQWWRGARERGAAAPDRELQWSLAIVAAVCVVTAAAGLAAGVAAGVLLAMGLFMHAMNRSLVRLHYSAAQIASRRLYPAPAEARLAPLRAQIGVIELDGALFFGNVEKLDREVRAAAQGCSQLVLDLRRVSTLDATGAVALAQLRDRLARQGTRLRLAGVTAANRHGRMMRSQGVMAERAEGWLLHADADHAIEAAELEVPPALQTLFDGLSATALAALQPLLARRELGAGERLFAQGDPGQSIYLVQRGSVSVVDRSTGQRFVSFSPGMCFGETAVLDGRGRTADALADEPSVVLELPAAVLAELEHRHPEAAARIFRNLALHLSERLRSAAAAWRLAAG